MDSNARFAVLIAFIIVAVGLSHWRLSDQIEGANAEGKPAASASAGQRADAEPEPPDHYKRMAEAAVTAKDPAARKSALRYLVMKSKSDTGVDPELADWARTELARAKAAESPGLLGKKLELEVTSDTPEVDRLDGEGPSVGRIEEPPDSSEDEYQRWGEDDESEGARPPKTEKGLVDPFSD